MCALVGEDLLWDVDVEDLLLLGVDGDLFCGVTDLLCVCALVGQDLLRDVDVGDLLLLGVGGLSGVADLLRDATELLECACGVPEDLLLEVLANGDLSFLCDVCVLLGDLLLGEYVLLSGAYGSLENLFL